MGANAPAHQRGTWRAVSLCGLMLCFALSACAVIRVETPVKIALLTSFEGRYREIGYNALYAAQLALSDSHATNMVLLPVDDGSTITSAADRAHALVKDPSVKMVLALGIYATATEVQQAASSIPVLIAGHWNAKPVSENTFILTNPDMDTEVTTPENFVITDAAQLQPPVTGSELLSLYQFPKLRDTLNSIMVISASTLPDADFRTHYLAMNQFAPEPGLLATLVYDATRMGIQSIQTQMPLSQLTYSGINGTISFDENRYWQDAPIHVYFYGRDRKLMPIIF
jgi:hypothetical protein